MRKSLFSNETLELIPTQTGSHLLNIAPSVESTIHTASIISIKEAFIIVAHVVDGLHGEIERHELTDRPEARLKQEQVTRAA